MSTRSPRQIKTALPQGPDSQPDRPLKGLDWNAQSLLDAVPDALLVVDRAGKIVVANVQAEKLFGYSREELIGRSVESLIPPGLRAGHAQHRENFFGDSRVRPMGMGLELFALRRDGTEVPVDINLSPLTDETGTFVVSTIRDATDRRRSEELKRVEAVLRETRESEERFSLVANTAPVLIWMSGPDKLCTYFNKPWLDFTGRSIEEEFGNGWAEGVHPEDLERCMDTYAQAFDRREEFRMEYRLRRHDGEYRWVLDIGVPRFNQDRSFVGYIGIGVDVTERKAAEEALHQKEAVLVEAQRLAGVGSWQWDQRTDRVTWSEGLYRLTGRDPTLPAPSRAEQVGGVFTPETYEREQRAVGEALQNGTSYELDMEVSRPDSTTRWVISRGEPLRDTAGQIIGLHGTLQDITERKLAEEALASIGRRLIEAQEQERTRIARELHDDTNQRLAMLAVGIENLKNELPEERFELRGRADDLRTQTLKISKDIRALAHKLHSRGLEYLGLITAAKGFCEEFGEQQKVEIGFKTHDLPGPLPPDVSLCLFRVLQEALHNSAKHSGVRKFEVQLWGMRNEVHLTVSDSGAGFDVEASKRSQGLGLIGMQERVKFLNGTFSIESQPRRGTTVHACVPLSLGNDSLGATG